MTITADEVTQELNEQLNSGIATDPAAVPEFFTNNIVGRTISYLLGWHYLTGEPVKIACQTDGSIRVVQTGSSVENNETLIGTAADAWSGTLSFPTTTTVLDIWAWDQALNIQRSIDDGVTWQDTIEIPAGGSASVNCQTNAVRVQNKTAGLNSRYQIVGWY